MSKNVIGLMSGTSVDGIDAALVNIDEFDSQLTVEIIDFISLPYTKNFKEKIFKAADLNQSRVQDIAELNIRLADKFVEAVFELLKKSGYSIGNIDLIASHGQTICHNVEDKNNIYTLQIGAGAVIAQKSGVTTVCNFRMRDLAAGGEGAPLIPYVDHLLYTSPDKNRVLQNIGGIANFTYLPAGADFDEIRGSDNGPGNMLIDYTVKILTDNKFDYDHDGQLAARGNIDQKLLNYMLKHPFIKREIPKSSGRRDFGETYAREIIKKAQKNNLKKEDIIATVTTFTAAAIVDSYQRFLDSKIDEIIVSGGGSYNKFLLQKIRELCQKKISAQVKVLTLEDIDQSSEAKEAAAFAVLGYQTLKGRKNNVPAATGAGEAVIMGDLIPADDFFDYLNW
ncbi:MAG: anhydro-N-acetylmuramic acid kinase [Halanaerobium sp.]